MKFDRSSGILVHPSSFPGRFGIGDLGPSAFSFLDFLIEAGCKLWQILPLGPTGYGDSPYQCFSAFAGNPYLISPELLLRDNLIHPNDLIKDMHFPKSHVEFGKIIPWKLNLLEKAFVNFSNNSTMHQEYDIFSFENSQWLNDYALFMALKETYGGGSWTNFPQPLRTRDPKALLNSKKDLQNNVDRYKFYQFIFFKQWHALKTYAHKLGIRIIGDIPLYVAHDSSDVWAKPGLFQLEPDGKPKVVAGVPPDYFSPTGQLWGNPIYRWSAHEVDGYQWWVDRMKHTLSQVDTIRLDHFRGFVQYWQVPAGEATAERGQWVQGPGIDLFKQLSNTLDWEFNFPIIAEDLGFITDDVVELRDHLDIPGMKILQFAFSGPDNVFLPHQFSSKCVVYTGTHDNDTSIGWFNSAPENERKFAKEYMGVDGNDIAWSLIRLGWASVANYAIAPMQDILRLDSSARMNYPGRIGGNWEWRMPENYNNKVLLEQLKMINHNYGRC
ncbi:MAG: 4-alpha-glucanotransferase [Chloroflexota bacterium]